MYKTLFRHYWLKSTRSPGFHKNLIINIFVGISIMYFLAILVLMGFMFPKILEDIVPGQDAGETFNGIWVYGVLFFLLVRYLIQPLSTLNLENYQSLPVKRNTLVNYLLLKPLFNPLNYLLLCFAIPFSIGGMYPAYGANGATRFLFLVLFLIWFNTLLAPLLKRRFGNLLLGTIVLLAIGAVFAALEHFHVFSLFQASTSLFTFLISTSYSWVCIAFPVLLAFLLNKHYFAKNYYPENIDKGRKRNEADTLKLTFMERFGKIGELISLEIRLVLRHKRTRNTLFTAIFFLLYGLLFYPNETYNTSPGWLLFIAIFITGIGMILFGQWIINWDGSHFDFLMTRDIDTRTYIRANYYLLLGLSILSFILTTPYFLFGPEIIVYHLVALAYNVGVNTYVYLYGATFNSNRLELSRGSSMNMQGTSYKNFIVMIPLLVVPVLLVVVFSLFSATRVALLIIASLGLAGILSREPLLRMVERQFLKKKYALCSGFRKKE